MVTERFKELISYLASCNGTGKEELAQRVASGEVGKDDAQLILYYVSVKKLHKKLDKLSKKAATV